MQWTTTFDIPEAQAKIDHHAHIYTVGSCFSTMIGEKLADRKFDVVNNPFGTLFNPLSISKVLEDSILELEIDEDMILSRDGLYLHYGMHSDVSAYSKDSLKRLIHKKHVQTKNQLENASHLMITFGTAWVYELVEEKQLVANCHKQPGHFFKKRLINLEEIHKIYIGLIQLLKECNPHIHVVLTVSPVRHVKDGIISDQLSKSLLRLACHQIADSFDFVHYFPSYEIMMDELRDYRFYKADKIHPSEEAEDYIWHRFKQSWIAPVAYPMMQEIEQIKKELAHRPFNPESPSHQKFLETLSKKIERLSQLFDFSKEMDQLRKHVDFRK
ncbi:GSCFA domain-containing protein [Belliella kenyensis]|uniref:GSCFA domain-containing protein n=1 Tax=Belliella kenyensis TaxID=1472724 RepID=A0ABV8EJH2_9BACT|nr:GSCFA domain-containing protein [Belliella kenyensis]MCH7400907.1 GSCFA domain-containing protein [Belliella kenyensis]MDN3603906.1 GSCFA domain-containing protein [Belliella kenyensis]